MGVLATASMSPTQKQMAIRKMKPVIAPIYTESTMARGASLEASLSSSVMWEGASSNSFFHVS